MAGPDPATPIRSRVTAPIRGGRCVFRAGRSGWILPWQARTPSTRL